MEAIHRQRLNKLAAYLKTVPPEQFDMDYWANADDDYPGECEFAGCALGWATRVFPELKLVQGEGAIVPVLVGSNWTGYDAASRLFGITYMEAVDLFSPDAYGPCVTPQGVAERIEAFAAGEEIAA